MRVTGFDVGAYTTLKHKEVTLMINSNERIVKHKIGLLNLAEELGNVSRACKVMGLSGNTPIFRGLSLFGGDYGLVQP